MTDRLLETELGYYESRKTELLAVHEGEFALIVGRDLVGVFENWRDAYRAGLSLRGNVPMLIQKVVLDEPIGIMYMRVCGLTYGGA